MTSALFGFIPMPASPPLLGTTGTELFQFGLLSAAGVWFARRRGRDSARVVLLSYALVSLFYLLCPADSAFQRAAGDAVMSGMASLQAGFMNLWGAGVRAEGPVVDGLFRFAYARGCMGLSYIAMAVLCLACVPVSWRMRVVGATALVSGMVLFNLLRLTLLYQLWVGGCEGVYEAFHRVGGGLFAVVAFALYCVVLRAGLPPRTTAVELPLTAPARA